MPQIPMYDLSTDWGGAVPLIASLPNSILSGYKAGRSLLESQLEQESLAERTRIAQEVYGGFGVPRGGAQATASPPALAFGQPQAASPSFVQMQPNPTGKGMQALIQSESGGNWGAQNNVMGAGGKAGHFGRLQFGQARLQDAMNAGALPQGTTPQQFMASPEMQKSVENWHFADIGNNIARAGLDKAIGQNIGGVPVTMQGMLNAAHLGGFGGLKRHIDTGGAYNPSDANGTRLSDYMAKGVQSDMPAQDAIAVQAATPQARTQTPAMSLAMQYAQSSNPNTRKAGVESLLKLGEKEQQYGFQTVGDQLVRTNPRTGQVEAVMSKPMNPLDEQLKQAQINEYKNKTEKKPTSVQEYEYAKGQGYQGSLLDYQKAITEAKTKNAGLSASDQKVIFQSEDEIPLLNNTIDTLKRAKELNNKTFTGYSADIRGKIGTASPLIGGAIVGREAASATREFGQIMKLEAIKSMSENLKGSTTNFELNSFVDILADPTTPPDIREKTINRMLTLAETQKKILTARANELRSKDPKRAQSGQSQQLEGGWQDMGGGIRIRAR